MSPPSRRILAQVCLGLALAGGPSVARGAEPRLILPGGRLVQAGEWIALRWAEADSICELEILISTDEGRHYSTCISPELDPRSREFVWQVPPLSLGTLRLRLRFNRGGREIEGAPASPMTVCAGSRDEPQPLALPPVTDAEKTPSSPNSREEAPAGRTLSGLIRDSEPFDPAPRSSHDCMLTTRPRASAPPGPVGPSRFLAPRSNPLRA